MLSSLWRASVSRSVRLFLRSRCRVFCFASWIRTRSSACTFDWGTGFLLCAFTPCFTLFLRDRRRRRCFGKRDWADAARSLSLFASISRAFSLSFLPLASFFFRACSRFFLRTFCRARRPASSRPASASLFFASLLNETSGAVSIVDSDTPAVVAMLPPLCWA